MDIDLLSKMIKELILDTDEVTLPGVGTFVAEIVPSTFSDKGYTINPPYRRLSFRQRQLEGGTMISDFYASSNNLDKESAEMIVNDFMKELKDVLQKKKMIIFPGLGRLRATKENNFFFVADEDLDIYPAGFGLEPVSLKTHEETAETVSATIASLKNIMVPDAPEAVPAEEPVGIPIVAEPSEDILPAEPEESPEEISEEAPEVVPEAVPEAVPEVSPEETPAAGSAADTVASPSVKPSVQPEIVILWIVLAAAALLILFAIVARIAPDLVDPLLYSKEELEILRYKL